MGYTVTEGCFTSKEEALAEIAAMGWRAVEAEVPAGENEMHAHDFESVTYVLGGTLRVEMGDGAI